MSALSASSKVVHNIAVATGTAVDTSADAAAAVANDTTADTVKPPVGYASVHSQHKLTRHSASQNKVRCVCACVRECTDSSVGWAVRYAAVQPDR